MISAEDLETVDELIRALVSALNQFPDLTTTESCAHGVPAIFFQVKGDPLPLLQQLAQRLEHSGVHYDLCWRWNDGAPSPCGILTVPLLLLDRATQALTSIT